MSYPRPQSIGPYNDNPIRNLEFVKPHPSQRYQSISIKRGKFCLLCGEQYAPDQKLCPEGHPNGRVFEPNELIAHGTTASTEHLRRKVEVCWNETIDPLTGDAVGHPLKVIGVPVVNLGYEEWHEEQQCEHCGIVYGWIKGRKASLDEMEAARQGKIALKTTDRAKIVRVG